MRYLAILTLVVLLEAPAAAPTCTIGSGSTSWKGSPLELAGIEAVYQREQAERDRRPYPNGAPIQSPWTALVRCTP